MKKCFVLLFTLCFITLFCSDLPTPYSSDKWIECDKIYVTRQSPKQEWLVMWMNTFSQPLYPVSDNYPFPGDWTEADRWMERYDWAGKSYPDDEWITVNVSDRVPEGTKAVFLTGILIVSYGATDIPANMTVKFRRKGETEEYKYIHQACITKAPECARSGISVWIPLDENGEFEFKWNRSTYGQWPEYPAYGMCLGLNAFAK